jgi:hypothetical protein
MRKWICVFVLALLAGPAFGATYSPTSHATMATAVGAVNAGDTITISGSWTASTGYEIADNNVVVNSSSPTNTILAGADTTAVIILSGTGQTVTGFKIDGDKDTRTDTIGVDISGSSATVSSMTIVDACLYGVRIYGGSTGNTVTGNTFTNNGKTGVDKVTYANAIRVNPTGSANVTNNIISADEYGSSSIVLNTPATGGVVSGNTIVGGDDGLYVIAGDTLTISNNSISNFALDNDSDGINIAGCLNCIVSRNTITQSANSSNAAWGIELTGNADVNNGSTVSNNILTGAYLNRGIGGGGSTITVSGNWIEAIDYGINQSNCGGSTYQYNMIIVNGGAGDTGIYLDSNAAGERVAYIYNNTIVDVGSSDYGIRMEETTGTWGAAAIKNNIITGFAKGLVIEDAGNNGVAVVHTYNSYYGNTANVQKDVAGTFSNESLGTGELTSDPVLLSNYRLGSLSPAIDAGTVLFTYALFPGDLAGRKISGSAPDIGAFEYQKPLGGIPGKIWSDSFKICASTNASCYTQP